MAGEPVEQSNLQCLVIGQEADPARGRELFKQAMQAWNHGQKTEALECYESAIIADHSILRHEDHGLAMALLEKYRDPARGNDLTTLCRRGFFENILVGNLESSIRFYEEAAQVATSDNDRQLAADEAVRLREQLSYITEWQKGIEQANRQLRARDLVEYEQAGRIAELQDQLEDGSGELEELQERLAYLQKQEKEALEGMYSSVRSAARYRRQHYYPGAYQTRAPRLFRKAAGVVIIRQIRGRLPTPMPGSQTLASAVMRLSIAFMFIAAGPGVSRTSSTRYAPRFRACSGVLPRQRSRCVICGRKRATKPSNRCRAFFQLQLAAHFTFAVNPELQIA